MLTALFTSTCFLYRNNQHDLGNPYVVMAQNKMAAPWQCIIYSAFTAISLPVNKFQHLELHYRASLPQSAVVIAMIFKVTN